MKLQAIATDLVVGSYFQVKSYNEDVNAARILPYLRSLICPGLSRAVPFHFIYCGHDLTHLEPPTQHKIVICAPWKTSHYYLDTSAFYSLSFPTGSLLRFEDENAGDRYLRGKSYWSQSHGVLLACCKKCVVPQEA